VTIPTSRGPIVVFGILFWYPLAGVTYQFLHYLLALRQLGWDPYYVEDSARWVYDPDRNDTTPRPEANLERVAPVLAVYGFGDRWAYRSHHEDGRVYGIGETRLQALYRDAAALLNVTGSQELRDEHMTAARRIYVESDPVKSQILVAQGDAEVTRVLAAHDTLFTFGENIGRPDCGVPVARFTWLPTRQPVALDLWPPEDGDGDAYTTIATWTNRNDVVYRGETYYWSKDREFEKVLDLPQCRRVPFELATQVSDATAARLTAHGWRLHDAFAVSRDVGRYHAFVCRSRAEFTVAKDQNVRLRSGWFSDRSGCYLAAGRPVITQDTGFGSTLPTGKGGLFAFGDREDVLAAVDAIESNYEGHRRAAREIAAEYFDGARVVGALLERAGLG
jgi:hypothetical protein